MCKTPTSCRADIYHKMLTLPIYLIDNGKLKVDNQRPHCKGGFIGTFLVHRDVYQSYNATRVIQPTNTFLDASSLNHT